MDLMSHSMLVFSYTCSLFTVNGFNPPEVQTTVSQIISVHSVLSQNKQHFSLIGKSLHLRSTGWLLLFISAALPVAPVRDIYIWHLESVSFLHSENWPAKQILCPNPNMPELKQQYFLWSQEYFLPEHLFFERCLKAHEANRTYCVVCISG